MPTDKPRFTLTVGDDLLVEIDDFRFENRFPTRTQAVLELIQRGLAQVEREASERRKEIKNARDNVLRKGEKV